MEKIINELAVELNLKKEQISTVLKMLDEGSTVPFIARYRKEQTRDLNEGQGYIRLKKEQWGYIKKKDKKRNKRRMTNKRQENGGKGGGRHG